MKGYSTTGRNIARRLRHDATDAELHLWRRLRDRDAMGVKFRRQHPIASYIVDFVCIEQRLIVEVDGGQHAERADYDERRTAVLEQAGFRVIRFWDNEVLLNTEDVVRVIFDALRRPSP